MIDITLSGATRLALIAGDGVRDLRSPAIFTEIFRQREIDAVMLAADVAPERFADFWRGAGAIRNLAGMVITMPHKFAAFTECNHVTARADFLKAVNVVRRMKSGEWVGDNFDGVGFVTALDGAGPRPEISSAFLVGAGGVGTAIAYELLNRGYKSLAIVDTNEARAQNLKDKLSAIFPDRLRNETKTPTGFDCVINATPLGMQAEDRLPFDIDAVSVEAVVGDVVTSCEITRLVRAARSRGCKTVTGEDMLKAQASMLASFILSEVNSFE